MTLTIYNESYNEIGVVDSWYDAIEFICMRAASARGSKIITYVYTEEDEELISRLVTLCEIEKNKIKIDWQPASEAARAALAAKQSEAVRK